MPGDAVSGAHTVDDWNTSRPSFCNWLNKENYQLQQAGSRYRVNEFTGDRRLVIDRQCPVTSAHLRDVSRTRLHSDTACDASQSGRYDNAESTTAVMSQDDTISYTPTDSVICANNYAAGNGMITYR